MSDKKRGRPKKENGKDKTLTVRLDEQAVAGLARLQDELELKSKGEVVCWLIQSALPCIDRPKSA